MINSNYNYFARVFSAAIVTLTLLPVVVVAAGNNKNLLRKLDQTEPEPIASPTPTYWPTYSPTDEEMKVERNFLDFKFPTASMSYSYDYQLGGKSGKRGKSCGPDCCRTTGTNDCCAKDEICVSTFRAVLSAPFALVCGKPEDSRCCASGPDDNACCDVAGGYNCIAPGVCAPVSSCCEGSRVAFLPPFDDSCCGAGETCIGFRVCGCPSEASDNGQIKLQEPTGEWVP